MNTPTPVTMDHASFIAYLHTQKFMFNSEKKDDLFRVIMVPIIELIDSAILYHIAQLPANEQADWKRALKLETPL